MNVVRNGTAPVNVANSPLFEGLVHSSPLIPSDDSHVGVSLVSFTAGARNKFHTHTADQILYITEGKGIVASRDHEHPVAAGDIVLVPSGEVHWHGAAPGHDMAHLSILAPSTTTIVE
ncbi:MAG: cupin domain-containing protein [Dehalococcoidia bacterium]